MCVRTYTHHQSISQSIVLFNEGGAGGGDSDANGLSSHEPP